tara:strand:- start:298 stop:768 length:471 start_codon:yes stop_codon:yes gene_type:complete
MKKAFYIYLLVFFTVNFGGLFLGGIFAGEAASSMWYQSANKAPWTPPGWVFGVAWTSIMICFTFYMSILTNRLQNKKSVLGLFIFQWLLNFGWNPVFFHFHQAILGLVIIILLTILVGYLGIKYRKTLNYNSIFLLPYFLWLIIASSLNAYMVIFN